MKANLEIKFLKIGNADVTQGMIDREAGLYASTNKTILILANSLKGFFERRRVKVEITASVQKDLTSNIEIKIISVLGKEVQEELFKKYFNKDIEKICRQLQRYFKKKKILIETKSTVS
jgi:hypothetical protein